MKHTIEDFKQVVDLVLEELYTYVDQSQQGKGKVLDQKRPEIISSGLDLEKLIRIGKLDKDNISAFMQKYLSYSQHMHHPHYIGHQVAVPHFSAGIADLIHGVVNNPMAVYEMGPAAATMEKVIINWMLDKVQWFKGTNLEESRDERIVGGGVLTHGGSLANLTAMLAARAKADPDAWTEGPDKNLVVLVPETSHYSLARSVSIMGLGAKNMIPMAVDQFEVVDPSLVEKSILEQKNKGKKIMALVANACATATGLYDPIDEISDICQKHNIWFHVDGAHGAGALITENKKDLMKGIYKADSLIWDAHKMLRTSALSAAVLFKDHKNLDQTFRQKGDYLIFDKEQIGYDFLNNTVECTKSGLGPKIFWALASEGESAIGHYIQEQYDKTSQFYHFINEQSDFECPYLPQSNILCFRYSALDPGNAFQLKLRNKLTEDGNFYITSANIREKRYLRLTVMNPGTDLSHIGKLLNKIRDLASGIDS
jgi:L-2,4-diaminobutyrate decarboxylase